MPADKRTGSIRLAVAAGAAAVGLFVLIDTFSIRPGIS
jgi:hypothetical protein